MGRSILFKKKIVHPITVFLSLIIIFVLGPFLIYNINFMGRIYPNSYVSGVNIGSKTPKDAVLLLSQKINVPTKINLNGQTQSFVLNTNDINPNYDFAESVDRVYNFTRTGNFFLDASTRVRLLWEHKNFGLTVNIDDTELTKFISVVAKKINVDPVYPSIQSINGVIQVNKGTIGSQVDNKMLGAVIERSLSYADGSDINIPVQIIDPTLSLQQIDEAKTRGKKYLSKALSLKFESQNFNYNEDDILSFLNPTGGYDDTELNGVILKIAGAINRDPQNPKFEFDGTKVVEFQPSLDGITLDTDKFKELLISTLDDLAESDDKNFSFDIPVTKKAPEVSTDQINDLGIKELIGRGTSTYFHSISGRIFNINLAASKINGTLVKPGDTFSFNQTLGDVSKLTGYKEAYIISEGRTILGDGGGVCQVSTTLFRSVLDAGLPITERAAHAYRVGYYEQNSPPGFDATVYSPSPDLKFKNDTPGYILIIARNSPKNYSLVFELYGTSDGRVASIGKPITSNITPSLPTVYQDDPTLPSGTLKQIDYAASGAKVTFKYLVARNGETIYQKTFTSNYQPWAAVYLRGTGPAN